jgi:hypothetical protein
VREGENGREGAPSAMTGARIVHTPGWCPPHPRTWYISVSIGVTKLDEGRSSVAGIKLGAPLEGISVRGK